MKKALLIAAAAAMTFGSVATASAQPYGYYGDRYYERDSDRDGRPDRREWNRDRDRDGRPDQWDRYDNRRGHRYGQNRWRTGQHYPYYNNRGYYISDYRAYRLPPPRAGYRYYRSDNGDIVMAAIATGIIGLIIADALNDNDRDHYRYDGGYYDRRW
ncbi:RcnB family protein [Phenylobacterium sp.]|uniref:RcnB family protein n=1 Tax=Phenylobacterium sp. TaxID=1871053 RepID=UPI002F929956